MSDPDQIAPAELAAGAAALAASVVPDDHGRLRTELTSPVFLARLNTEDEYARLRIDELRITGIIDALAANDTPIARGTLAHLAADPAFLDDDARQEVLLVALATVRPAPPEVARFFATHIDPEGMYLNLAIFSIVENGSEPAIAVIERTLAAGEQEPEDVDGWFHDAFVRHRQDPPLLAMCERLLTTAALEPSLQVALIESLFDYRPDAWYPADSDLPRPPARTDASPEACALLRRIGIWAQTAEAIPAPLRSRVRTAVAELPDAES